MHLGGSGRWVPVTIIVNAFSSSKQLSRGFFPWGDKYNEELTPVYFISFFFRQELEQLPHPTPQKSCNLVTESARSRVHLSCRREFVNMKF